MSGVYVSPPPMDGFSDAELVVGSVTVLRGWIHDGRSLLGTGRSVPWNEGENTAECIPEMVCCAECAARVPRHPEAVPYDRCGCGFWAYYVATFSRHPFYTVVGLVECYGRMLIGSRGVRAEKARILALTPSLNPGVDHTWTRRVMRRYVDLGRVYPTAEWMLGAFDVTDPPRHVTNSGVAW